MPRPLKRKDMELQVN